MVKMKKSDKNRPSRAKNNLISWFTTTPFASILPKATTLRVSTPRVWGFTLIELLVVISIISLLSSIVLSSVGTARDKARLTKAQAEIREVRTAIGLLESDTGKWPNGCEVGEVVVGAGNKIELTNACSGITQTPLGSGCTCT